MKLKGIFTIKDTETGKIELEQHNDLLKKGARWFLSLMTNTLLGDGYPANANKYIHYGSSDVPCDPENEWHLRAFTGSLGQTTTGVKVSDDEIEMGLNFISSTITYINELAIGLTASDPTSPTNYANAVLDRAVLASTYIIPKNITKTITYRMKIYET